MASSPIYRYLNNTQIEFEKDLLFSHFAKVIAQGQKRMPAGQWPNFIKGLTNKGVKKTEIDDSGVLEHLVSLDPKAPITREQIVEVIHNNLFTIKEVDLTKPQYENWSNSRDPHHLYQESLYVLNSPKMNIEDRLADIQWELEDLDFEPERLFENPTLAVDLHNERQNLLAKAKMAPHHHISHFTKVKDPQTGNRIENVLAHSRFTVRDDVFFIEEIQSDWGQLGRQSDWQRAPKAPYVTNTETWSGLVLRRLLQRAASMPEIKRVAWIVGGMENGGKVRAPEGVNHYYRNVLPKIADKALSGTGEKTKMSDIKLRANTEAISLPSIEMTDKVREKFRQSQTLYSHDLLEPQNRGRKLNALEQKKLDTELKSAQEMLGDSVSIILAKNVIDYATGREVAGSMMAPLRLLQANLNARDPGFVLHHEVYHYAHECLISPDDARVVERAFADGSTLNSKVRAALVRRGASPEAVAQCDESTEAAAYGFALWKRGEISLNRLDEHDSEDPGDDFLGKTVGRTFRKVERAFISLTNWAKRAIGLDQSDRDANAVKGLFTQVSTGRFAIQDDGLQSSKALQQSIAGFIEHEPPKKVDPVEAFIRRRPAMRG